MPYWFNVDTGAVETDETRSQDANVLGPYETEEAAANALTAARERTEAWDAEDREWEQRGSKPSFGED
ncbi:methionine aminopeptidase [Phycicoccus flavus]|uniref:methionine aminopeptidase n=1 Tax=Phycicoccus flavus TaxID=2502783 RepID=UPI000FEC18B8|nr:methionine aminopeptidase [Phycicoccus flavus]NHA67742.1 methionine aminopeptidase [Phycicoccus flavus]